MRRPVYAVAEAAGPADVRVFDLETGAVVDQDVTDQARLLFHLDECRDPQVQNLHGSLGVAIGNRPGLRFLEGLVIPARHLWSRHGLTPFVRYLDRSVMVDAAAMDSTGVKLAYTVPAGRSAELWAVSVTVFGGSPTIRTEFVRGTDVIQVAQNTGGFVLSRIFLLEAGDIIRLNVTAAGAAGTTADIVFSLKELVV